MRVVVAVNEGLFRPGLAARLEERGHDVVGRARDGFEALEQVRRLRPDVVLLDTSMPQCAGLEATRLIEAEPTDTKIVLVAASSDAGELTELAGSSIAGYVLKDRSPEELTRVLDALAGDSSAAELLTPVGKER